MSQIVTLYSDKERTDALYPRTKVSAISDDNNTPLKELMTGTVKQEEGGTEEEVVTPINADTLGGKLTANNVVFYEEEMVDEFGQVVVRNADKLENHPASYFATGEELNTAITNGTLKVDLLWTNASPGSQFDTQSISLDTSKYKSLLVTILSGAGDGIRVSFLVNKRDSMHYLLFSGHYDNGFYYRFRKILALTDTYITFDNGQQNNEAPNNYVCIPYQIYGVR